MKIALVNMILYAVDENVLTIDTWSVIKHEHFAVLTAVHFIFDKKMHSQVLSSYQDNEQKLK